MAADQFDPESGSANLSVLIRCPSPPPRVDRGRNNIVWAEHTQEIYDKQLSRVNYYRQRIQEFRIKADLARNYYGSSFPDYEKVNAENTAKWENLLETYEGYLKSGEEKLKTLKEDLKFYKDKEAEYVERCNGIEDGRPLTGFPWSSHEVIQMFERDMKEKETKEKEMKEKENNQGQ